MRKGYQEDIRKGRIGSIFNAFTARYTRELQRLAVEATRLKIPLLSGYDVIHGHRTIFPISLGEAASWDLQAIEKAARISATEAYDRKRVVSGKSVSVRGEIGGRRNIKKKN